jgi:hypothetical protein
MNERIEKLAEQAGYKHPDAVGMCEDYAYFSHEKFAELIVRECADVATINAHQWESPGTYVLKHFGVTE